MNSDARIDAAAFKHLTALQWDDAAAGWNKHGPAIRNWLRVPTDAMLEMAGVSLGQTVLDVAAGAGDQSLDIAAKVGGQGTVVATDISKGILSYALANAVRSGRANVSIHVADAEALGLKAATFDAAVCRLGLMFLPDPLAGLSEVYRVLKPGGRFCSMVFAGPDLNPCLGILTATAMRAAGLAPHDPFLPGGLVSLGKPGLIDDLFQRAGFHAVATTKLQCPFRLPGTKDYLTFIRDSAGPILQILAPLDQVTRVAAWAEMEAKLEVYQTEAGWVGPNTLLLTVGQR